MQLFTARYTAKRLIAQADAVPVATTVGQSSSTFHRPAFHSPSLAPYGVFGITHYSTFRERYRERLGRLGLDHIATELETIATLTGCPRLALLCFDDLTKPDNWCHRRMFAEWWEEQTGMEVPELGRMAEAQPELWDAMADLPSATVVRKSHRLIEEGRVKLLKNGRLVRVDGDSASYAISITNEVAGPCICRSVHPWCSHRLAAQAVVNPDHLPST